MELGRLGYDVAVHYRTSRNEAELARADLVAMGVASVALQADVTLEAEAQRLVDEAAASFGRLDVVVNNVGNYDKRPLAEVDGAAWRAMFDSNLHATFDVTQRALPHLRASPRGRVINLGYAGSERLHAKPAVAAYAIAKTGVLLYSRALAHEEIANGITVNVLAPGVIENSDSMPLREIPAGRVGRLDEMAGALRYLVSPEADYVTGAFLPVAGGWNL
jgi:NAD(P)-dependent dehydrogenase (short-subunit alcohol dehydrogenase family)